MAKLVNLAAEKRREKQNLKVVVGVEFTIMKPIEGDDVHNIRTIHAHAMPEAVYSEDAITKFIRGKKVICKSERKQELTIKKVQDGHLSELMVYS